MRTLHKENRESSEKISFSLLYSKFQSPNPYSFKKNQK